MTITGPIENKKSFDNVICPRCGTRMPSHALFCSACGETIKKGGNEEEADTKKSIAYAQTQDVDATVRLPPLSRTQRKHVQAYLSLKDTGTTEQANKESSLPQNGDAPAIKDAVGQKLVADETPGPASRPGTSITPTGPPSKAWGWLPPLSLTSAAGVLLVALADNAGRFVLPWTEPLWWFGLLVLFLPIAWRLFLQKPTRRERIALLVVLGMSLYFVKFLQYPLYFTYFDELTHTRTVHDIASTGHLFHANPVLPISPYYPGLEIVTNAISNLTGLSLFPTGIVLLAVVRLLFVLTLYRLYEYVSNSEQVAAIATLLYVANPGFLFNDTEFAYESLALPLAVFVVFAVARCYPKSASRGKGLVIVSCLAPGAVVMSHHVTSFALAIFLLFWSVLSLLPRVAAIFHRNRSPQNQPGPFGIALLALVLCAVWLQYTGGLAIGYLSPYFGNASHQLALILAGEEGTRQLFHSGSAFVLPLWERVMTIASVILLLLGLPFGLLHIWRRYRSNMTALAFAGIALAYPASLAVRLTPSGGEVSNRSSEFVFLGLAFALAIGAVRFWVSRPARWQRSVLIIVVTGIIFVGQVITGNGQPWSLLPGPYLVIADERSVEPEGIAAAQWADSYLGPGHHVATDRINMLLMSAYGNQWVITSSTSVASVFTSPQFGPTEQTILRNYRIQYLVVDQRLSTALPRLGIYFSMPASTPVLYNRPIDRAALTKFDDVVNISRVFDSGNIVVYSVEALYNGPPLASHCMPAPPTNASSSLPELGRLYAGTIFDMSKNLSTEMTLAGMYQQGNSLCGTFTGLDGTAPIKGSITPEGHIQFVALNSAGQTKLSFDGFLKPGGMLTGSFCRPKAGHCSSYGIWSLSPTT